MLRRTCKREGPRNKRRCRWRRSHGCLKEIQTREEAEGRAREKRRHKKDTIPAILVIATRVYYYSPLNNAATRAPVRDMYVWYTSGQTSESESLLASLRIPPSRQGPARAAQLFKGRVKKSNYIVRDVLPLRVAEFLFDRPEIPLAASRHHRQEIRKGPSVS